MELRPRILAVDDKEENLIALCAALEALDVEVVSARSGPQALRQLLAGDFALVIMDVQMPGMDGFETAAVIKQRERSRRTPILFLTAISRDPRFIAQGYDVGAVDYLSRPVDTEILRAKVAVFAELWRAKALVAEQAELLRKRQAETLRLEGERRYRDLAESMPLIVWTADASGALTYANDAWFRASGIGRSEGTLDFASVVHPEDAEGFLASWRIGLAGGEAWSGDFRFGNPQESTWRWCQVRVVHNADEIAGGGPVMVGTATDIDARRRAEQSLQVLVRVSESLASAQDEEAALATASACTIPMLGDACLADMLTGTTPRRVACSGFPLAHAALLMVDPRAPREGLVELLGSAGEAVAAAGFRWFVSRDVVARGRVLARLTWLGRRGAELGGHQSLLDDVVARTAVGMDALALLADAQRERHKLAEANRSKDEFLATLSHELRTPLNAVLGWTRLLRSGDLTGEAAERALEVIERNGRVQAQLVADLLDVSRIVSGKLHLEIAPIDVNEVATACVVGLLPVAEKRNQVLTVDVAEGPFVVSGDRARLHQVFSNLLSNALKFTPEGGSIAVEIRREGDDVLLSVTDSGQGISGEFLPMVFERFTQADGSSTRKHGGLGLGLSIVRHVVLLHRGDVDVASPGPGKGATFVVRLPCSRETHARTEERPSYPESEGTFAGKRALLVEDDPDGQRLATTVLRRWGLSVVAVGSVPEALEALAEGAFDVLVSDVGLPDRDGYDLVREVRARESGGERRMPAVALTAFASAEDRARALEAGFDAHVAKPINTAILHASLVEILAVAS